MKVVFNCSYNRFHLEYYHPIADELSRREHSWVGECMGMVHEDADFTISADESMTSLGGRNVNIGHSFDMKGVIWANENTFAKTRENADFMFVYSDAYKKIAEEKIGLPTYVVGMPKLDTLFKKRSPQRVWHAPTHNWDLRSVVSTKLRKEFNIQIHEHPAYMESDSSVEVLNDAKLLISDYSSMAVEAICLNIPVILIPPEIKNEHERTKEMLPSYGIYECATVANRQKLRDAIKLNLEYPQILNKQRKKFRDTILSYRGIAAERTVNILEEIYETII